MSWSLLRFLRSTTEAAVEALLAGLAGAVANPQDTNRLIWCDGSNFRWLDDIRVIQTDLSYAPATVREGCQAYILTPSAARTIDVSSATVNIGACIYIRNLGSNYSISFKQSSSVSSTIAAGQFAMFMWNGSTWDLIYGTSAPPPLGYVYIQGVNDTAPGTLWPGTTWTDVSSEEAGRYRRIKGTTTAVSGSTVGDSVQGDTQTDLLATHVHPYGIGVGSSLTAGTGYNAQLASSGGTCSASAGSPSSTNGAENRPLTSIATKWRRTE